jgi:hypothetical protein
MSGAAAERTGSSGFGGSAGRQPEKRNIADKKTANEKAADESAAAEKYFQECGRVSMDGIFTEIDKKARHIR